VRKADGQVRITTQLIDAIQDYHLWTERYDRPLRDIFALQDEIVQKIVTTLQLQLTLREQGAFLHKTTENLEAYDFYLRGVESLFRLTKETHAQARQMFEKAIELDSKYADAYVALGRIAISEWVYQWSPNPQKLEEAFELGQKALALDDTLPAAYYFAGHVSLFKKLHEQAIAEEERAIALDPNTALGYAELGLALTYAGRPEEAIGVIEKAMRLNPRSVFFPVFLSFALHFVGRDKEAIATLKSALLRNPDYIDPHVQLAVIYSELGREIEARAEAAEVLRISPNLSLDILMQRLPFKDPATTERYLTALRKAGLQ
jgi:tetratricopeptide (TPR) repeat protein